jgi:hypothetical protein
VVSLQILFTRLIRQSECTFDLTLSQSSFLSHQQHPMLLHSLHVFALLFSIDPQFTRPSHTRGAIFGRSYYIHAVIRCRHQNSVASISDNKSVFLSISSVEQPLKHFFHISRELRTGTFTGQKCGSAWRWLQCRQLLDRNSTIYRVTADEVLRNPTVLRDPGRKHCVLCVWGFEWHRYAQVRKPPLCLLINTVDVWVTCSPSLEDV